MNCMTILHTLRRPAATVASFALRQPVVKNSPHFHRLSQCRMTAKKRALVFLAPGFEEIEFVTSVDVLRRGGVEVVVAGTESADPVCGSHCLRIVPDIELSAVKETFDALVLPGGLGGSNVMKESCLVGEMLKEQEKHCRIVAAICAAPTALKAHGIAKGKSLTSYPAMEKEMTDCGDYKYQTDDVVVDDWLITSRGPATSMKFALTILKQLTDDVKACEVAKGMLCM